MHTARFKMPSGHTDIDVELPELTTALPDGSVGVYQRRQDDCMRAALATCLAISYEEAPDWEARPEDGRAAELAGWDSLSRWATARGLRLRFHNSIPEDLDRYIVVGAGWKDGFRHVAAVMNGHVFEPGSGFRLPGWLRLEPIREVEFSISFEKGDEQ